MNYEKVISALSAPEISRYVRDGVSHSYPVVGLYDGKIADCFFLYCVSLSDKEYAEAPLYSLKVDSEDGTLKVCKETVAQKFNNSLECDDETFWNANGEFEELYPKIRSFAFSKTIDPLQRETLTKFVRTLKVLVNNSFYSIYVELFTEFFNWVDEVGTR